MLRVVGNLTKCKKKKEHLGFVVSRTHAGKHARDKQADTQARMHAYTHAHTQEALHGETTRRVEE